MVRVCVYAIALNEVQFVDRFMDSVGEADLVLVADTGSTDGTVERLRERGAVVHSVSIRPWRFDDARNTALALIPDDIDVCVTVDLDEVLGTGWSERLRSAWVPGTTRGRYLYVWSHNSDGSPGVQFMGDRVHARHGYRWRHPCHETLHPDRTEEHYADLGYEHHHWPDESKSRGQYLPLLEVAAAEAPHDPRSVHYLGREYMFRGMWEKGKEMLLQHLALPGATWVPERAASMRYLAKCCRGLGEAEDARVWAWRAAQEAPDLREGWVQYALECHEDREWAECELAAVRALAITERPAVYTTEPWAWGPLPYDLASIAAWNLGERERALLMGEQALALAPDDERIAANVRMFREVLGIASVE